MHPSHGHDQTIVNGISRIGYMTGGKAALWKDEDMADVFTRKATAFIEQHRGKPFFLFFAPHDPHVPRVPHPRFAGATPMGPRGDAIAQLDWSVGEVLATLDRLELADDTLVLFTSDNGPVVDDGYRDEAVEKLGDHAPSGPFRGGKYSNFEGGTRVPFVVRWPARVKPAVSDALISQVDLIATFAALVGRPLSDPGAPDSENVLPALLGTSKTARAALVEQAGSLLRSGRDSGSTSSPARGREFSRTRTPSSATIPSRSFTIWRRTRASGTISPRRVPRRFASWPRCWRASGAPPRSRSAVRTSSSPSPTTGRFLTPASTAIGPSARRISIVSRGKGSGSRTPSSRRRRARRRARRC